MLGIGGALLFYSGNLLWVEVWRKKRQTLQPVSGVFFARLNSGVCIGCMAASMHRRLQYGDANSVWAGAGTGLPNAQVADR